MTMWSVFEPEEAQEERTGAWADSVVFVPERLSWSSIPLAPLVLLRHQLWLGLIGYLLFQGAIGATMYGLDIEDGFALLMIGNLAVAVLLPGLRRSKLIGHGHEEVAVIVAPTLEAAEQRYFEARLSSGALRAQGVSYIPERPTHRFAGDPILGLFPEAGR
ncbi:DUF2628 domain-containing protein [Ancylobacter radicis]|uniref:DUF2628 domain-containing protein n=1 Tax=Ancylobacter radicis TaxID=2836179 RepID=A0ABS5R9C9_9HYPH|nr:DUF2628 domain-containing protein [Ancylobacter radicis]MBS9477466.1 DUF2628 domain-containing protein [Ancylobacter radicis]